jgi:hypothetical protein
MGWLMRYNEHSNYALLQTRLYFGLVFLGVREASLTLLTVSRGL